MSFNGGAERLSVKWTTAKTLSKSSTYPVPTPNKGITDRGTSEARAQKWTNVANLQMKKKKKRDAEKAEADRRAKEIQEAKQRELKRIAAEKYKKMKSLAQARKDCAAEMRSSANVVYVKTEKWQTYLETKCKTMANKNSANIDYAVTWKCVLESRKECAALLETMDGHHMMCIDDGTTPGFKKLDPYEKDRGEKMIDAKMRRKLHIRSTKDVCNQQDLPSFN